MATCSVATGARFALLLAQPRIPVAGIVSSATMGKALRSAVVILAVQYDSRTVSVFHKRREYRQAASSSAALFLRETTLSSFSKVAQRARWRRPASPFAAAISKMPA